jgi:hypothetical protein
MCSRIYSGRQDVLPIYRPHRRLFAPSGSTLRLYLPLARNGGKRQLAELGHNNLLISPEPIVVSLGDLIRPWMPSD